MKKIPVRQQIEWVKGRIKQPIAMGDVAYMESILESLQTVTTDYSDRKYPLFQDFVVAYWTFCRTKGVEGRMTAANGKALKEIISYLMRLEKIDGSEEQALEAWRYIFAHWNEIGDFYQHQIGLMQINKNIQEIIYQLQNVNKANRNKHNKSEIDRLEHAIKARK